MTVEVIDREDMREAISDLRSELLHDIDQLERKLYERDPKQCAECGVMFVDRVHKTTLLSWCPVCKKMVSVR